MVRRTVMELEPQPSTRIEAAIDEGEIRATEGMPWSRSARSSWS
jgi:hypothetical protein